LSFFDYAMYHVHDEGDALNRHVISLILLSDLLFDIVSKEVYFIVIWE
jgi:hypothetical protein